MSERQTNEPPEGAPGAGEGEPSVEIDVEVPAPDPIAERAPSGAVGVGAPAPGPAERAPSGAVGGGSPAPGPAARPPSGAAEGGAPGPAAERAPPAAADAAAAPGPAAEHARSLVGTTISGRYHIHELIAAGGMGVVYRGEHIHLRKRLAVKVLHPETENLPELVERFRREALVGAHARHPHVAAATDFGTLDDGSYFLVLEHVRGVTLYDAIRGGPMPATRAVHIARQLAEALDALHARGIVHRDVKPQNVMLVNPGGEAEPRGESAPASRGPDFVKLIDFGLATVELDRLPSLEMTAPVAPMPRERLTGTGMIFGTIAYLAPEAALGMDAVDHRSDLYALGIVLYEMLCGRRPFRGDRPADVIAQHVSAPPPPFREMAPGLDLPPALERITRRLLAKVPAERFQRGAEVVAALDEALGARVTPVPSEPRVPTPLSAPRPGAGTPLSVPRLGAATPASVSRLGAATPASVSRLGAATPASVPRLGAVTPLSVPRLGAVPPVGSASGDALHSAPISARDLPPKAPPASPAQPDSAAPAASFSFGYAAALVLPVLVAGLYFISTRPGSAPPAAPPAAESSAPASPSSSSPSSLSSRSSPSSPWSPSASSPSASSPSAPASPSASAAPPSAGASGALPGEGRAPGDPAAPASAAPAASAASEADLERLRTQVRQASSKTYDYESGRKALVALGTLDPPSLTRPNFTSAAVDVITNAEESGKPGADELFALLSSARAAPHGLDLLYDVVHFRGGRKAAKRALELLRTPEVAARASPALRVTFAFREADCPGKDGLAERTVAEGDGRTLLLLKIALGSCGRTPTLEKAYNELLLRLIKK